MTNLDIINRIKQLDYVEEYKHDSVAFNFSSDLRFFFPKKDAGIKQPGLFPFSNSAWCIRFNFYINKIEFGLNCYDGGPDCFSNIEKFIASEKVPSDLKRILLFNVGEAVIVCW